MITKDQILKAQESWGNGVVKIGSLMEDFNECEMFAINFLGEHYSFESGDILFKPTKCESQQFRPTILEALSYFIAGENKACAEDKGFALNPWTKVRFENSGFIIEDSRAIAMGNYYFTDLTGVETKVEYTFGYKLSNGDLKIDLHHSSLPFKA